MYGEIVTFMGFFILPFLLPIAVIWLLVKLIRAHQTGDSHTLMEQLKRSSLGVAIAILLPLFLYYLVGALAPGTTYSTEAQTFEFGVGLVLGLLSFLLGLMARRVPVVGNGIATGGFVYLIYLITLNFPSFSPAAQLATCVAALALIVGGAYYLHFRDIEQHHETPTLSGFKGAGVGILTFLVSNMVISYTMEFVAELSGVNAPVDMYGYATDFGVSTQEFVTILIMAITFLLFGMTVRAIRPVSVGMLAAGIMALATSVIYSFSEIGQLAAALTTGLALALLIGYGYYKFSHQDEPASTQK